MVLRLECPGGKFVWIVKGVTQLIPFPGDEVLDNTLSRGWFGSSQPLHNVLYRGSRMPFEGGLDNVLDRGYTLSLAGDAPWEGMKIQPVPSEGSPTTNPHP